MEVETYETETANGQLYATEEERAQLIQMAEDLALAGQKTLINAETGDVFPYRQMTVAEQNVYGVLLTQRTKIEDFKDSVIPLRVMQVIAHTRSLNDIRVGYLEVWHQPGDKDPILVGRESYYKTAYLLARWGDELEAFTVLQKKALERLRFSARAWGEKIQAAAGAFIASSDNTILGFINGERGDWKPSMHDLER